MLHGLHIAGLVLVAVVSGAVAWWIRQQTRDRAGTAMIALLAVHTVMALLASMALLVETMAASRILSLVIWALVLGVPVVWLLFAIYYTGREYWLSKPAWALLAGFALVPPGLVLTEPSHGLLFADVRMAADPIAHLRYQTTGLMTLLFVASQVPAFLGYGLLFRLFLFSRRDTRRQTVALLVGMTAIIVTAGVADSEFVPLRDFAYGVYGAGVFGVLVAVALFRNRMFAVAPLARDELFESIDDAIVVTDADRRIVDFNGTASELFPALESGAGDPLEEVYSPFVAEDDGLAADGHDSVVERLETATNTPFAGALRYQVAGETRTFRVNVHEVKSGGEPRGYGLIVRDVSELEAYATELERKNEKLERFAGVLSHDLRNPVSIATGYVEQALAEDDADHAADALAALERVEETIQDLLALARQGRAIDESDTVSLGSIAGEAWETSDTGDLTLRNELDAEYRVQADPSRLRTLLENLFRNAAEHGGETVRIGRIEGGFFVADDGPGIPPAERERVFESGYSSADGTGLGLAIVAEIADAHGWTVTVTESQGGGARFEVRDVRQPARSSPSGPVADLTGSAGARPE